MADAAAVAAPAFDPAQFKALVTEGVREVVAETQAAQQRQAQQQQAAIAQAQQSQIQTGRDPIADVIAPVVNPMMQAAILQGQAGQDAAVFYATTPQAAKHASFIEERFQHSMAQGRPIKRSDLWHHYRGEHFEKFAAEEQAQREEAARLAEQAATVGGGMPRTLVGATPKDPHDMQPDEMDTYLSDKAF